MFSFEKNLDPDALYAYGRLAGPDAKIQLEVSPALDIAATIVLPKNAAEAFKDKLHIKQPLPQ